MPDEQDADPPRQVGGTEGNLLLDVHVLHERVGELLATVLRPHGVRPSEYAVYSQLGPDSMTPRELSARLGLSRSTLTGHLATLVARGDLARTPHPVDGRSYLVALTAQGRARLEACRPGFVRALDALHAHLATDRAALRRQLVALDTATAAAVEVLKAPERPPSR